MMEAISTSEMSLNLYQPTWCNIPEDSHLHNRRRENLKCHQVEQQLRSCRYLSATTEGNYEKGWSG
jgi:hypothetical protein